MKELISTPFGDYRFPSEIFKKEAEDSSFQPWDAADELLLDALSTPAPGLQGDREPPGESSSPLRDSLLILNDTHGALSTPLTQALNQAGRSSAGKILLLTPSLSAGRRCAEVCLKNTLRPPELCNFNLINSPQTADPDDRKALAGVAAVALKIPRALDFFTLQLEALRSLLPPDTPIYAAGTARELPISFFDAFSAACDQAAYSLIKKRARLYTGRLKQAVHKAGEAGLPVPTVEIEIPLPGRELSAGTPPGLRLISLPGTYSHGKLDPGSRFLIEALTGDITSSSSESPLLAKNPAPRRIADPGCGSGLLSLTAALLWPQALISGTDDSFQAVTSAGLSADANGLTGRTSFRQADILEGEEDGQTDLVLCNPPFHSGRRISMALPFRFIEEAARVLRSGGTLMLVANRNLGYIKKMKSLFGRAEVVRENGKFKIYRCIK